MPFEYNDVDWDEAVEPKGFEPLPAGIYDFVIVGADADKTKPNAQGQSKDAVNVQLQVESDQAGGQYVGRSVFDLWVMPDKASQTPDKFKESMGFLKQRVEVIYGKPVRECLRQLPDGTRQLDPRDLLGRRGKMQLGIKQDPNPAGGLFPPRNTVRYLAASENAVPQAQAYNAGTPAQPQQQPQPQPAGASATQAFRL